MVKGILIVKFMVLPPGAPQADPNMQKSQVFKIILPFSHTFMEKNESMIITSIKFATKIVKFMPPGLRV